MKLTLADFRVLDTHEILVTWSDDHRSLFGPQYLRLACPCAQCVDEWSGKRVIQADQIPENITALSWEFVGHYGMKINWSDHHQTGIYSFDYLRKVCTCSECQKTRQHHHETKD